MKLLLPLLIALSAACALANPASYDLGDGIKDHLGNQATAEGNLLTSLETIQKLEDWLAGSSGLIKEELAKKLAALRSLLERLESRLKDPKSYDVHDYISENEDTTVDEALYEPGGTVKDALANQAAKLKDLIQRLEDRLNSNVGSGLVKEVLSRKLSILRSILERVENRLKGETTYDATDDDEDIIDNGAIDQIDSDFNEPGGPIKDVLIQHAATLRILIQRLEDRIQASHTFTPLGAILKARRLRRLGILRALLERVEDRLKGSDMEINYNFDTSSYGLGDSIKDRLADHASKLKDLIQRLEDRLNSNEGSGFLKGALTRKLSILRSLLERVEERLKGDSTYDIGASFIDDDEDEDIVVGPVDDLNKPGSAIKDFLADKAAKLKILIQILEDRLKSLPGRGGLIRALVLRRLSVLRTLLERIKQRLGGDTTTYDLSADEAANEISDKIIDDVLDRRQDELVAIFDELRRSRHESIEKAFKDLEKLKQERL